MGLPVYVDMAVGESSLSRATIQCEKFAATINVANLIAHQSGDTAAGEPHTHDLEPATQESMELLGLTPEVMPDLVRQTEKGLKRVESLTNPAITLWFDNPPMNDLAYKCAG